MDVVADLTIAVAGVLFPAFATYKSLLNKTQQNRLIWLRYWVVFSVFYVFKTIGDLILTWLPFYYVAQVLVVLWISSSKASGAQIVYLYAVVPLLKDNEAAIDRFILRHSKDATVVFWQLASGVGVRWSAALCHILRLYIETAFSGASLQNLPAIQHQPALMEQEETESDSGNQLPAAPDEDMFSDDDVLPVVQRPAVVAENPLSPTPRTSRRKRASQVKRSTRSSADGDAVSDN